MERQRSLQQLEEMVALSGLKVKIVEEDDELREIYYQRGRKDTAARFLRECMDTLNPEQKKNAQLIIERDRTVASLRQVCEVHGDNDWPDGLNLSDVINNHLWSHLENPE